MSDEECRKVTIVPSILESGANFMFERSRALSLFALVATVALASLLSGCINSEIAAGRMELEKGNYSVAHERFVAASHSSKLSGRERRELADGLCVTESKLETPRYPLATQRTTCAAAVALGGSASGPILATIDSTERVKTATAVHAALAEGDIAGAEGTVVSYQTFPGADQNAIAEWSKQIWAKINDTQKQAQGHDRHLASAIAEISHHYPHVRAMNDPAFKRWVMDSSMVSGTPLVERVVLRDRTLHLEVASRNLPEVAFNLDHFITINDAMVARCRCDGRTNIAVEGSGLPAYLVRVDTDTRTSAALVMPQPH
jgi:hypothetical protein